MDLRTKFVGMILTLSIARNTVAGMNIGIARTNLENAV
jgi:hypothetical protein